MTERRIVLEDVHHRLELSHEEARAVAGEILAYLELADRGLGGRHQHPQVIRIINRRPAGTTFASMIDEAIFKAMA